MACDKKARIRLWLSVYQQWTKETSITRLQEMSKGRRSKSLLCWRFNVKRPLKRSPSVSPRNDDFPSCVEQSFKPVWLIKHCPFCSFLFLLDRLYFSSPQADVLLRWVHKDLLSWMKNDQILCFPLIKGYEEALTRKWCSLFYAAAIVELSWRVEWRSVISVLESHSKLQFLSHSDLQALSNYLYLSMQITAWALRVIYPVTLELLYLIEVFSKLYSMQTTSKKHHRRSIKGIKTSNIERGFCHLLLCFCYHGDVKLITFCFSWIEKKCWV